MSLQGDKGSIMSRGQVSLEWALLSVAWLGVLAVLFAGFQLAWEAGQWGLDAQRAQRFTDSVEEKILLLQLLGPTAKLVVTADPLNAWIVSVESNKLLVTVRRGEQEKTFFRSIALSAREATWWIEQKQSFVLYRTAEDFLVLEPEGDQSG